MKKKTKFHAKEIVALTATASIYFYLSQKSTVVFCCFIFYYYYTSFIVFVCEIFYMLIFLFSFFPLLCFHKRVQCIPTIIIQNIHITYTHTSSHLGCWCSPKSRAMQTFAQTSKQCKRTKFHQRNM